MKKIIFMSVLLLSFTASALEIDEKLTLRIIKTSGSKKTVLINRGIEDGLVKGDHAKFFVSEGVVARGVFIKGAPTRSVWSIYRLVNSDFLRKDQVMKLKITPAVKITNDESRMLVSDDPVVESDPRDLGIPLAEGANDISDADLIKTRGPGDMNNFESKINLVERNKEIYGMIDYTSFTEKTSASIGNDSYSKSVDNMNFLLGGEWYFKTDNMWYSRISFSTYFKMDRKAVMGHQGAFVKRDASEFGFGGHFHIGKNKPHDTHKLIPYLGYHLAIGSSKSSYSPGLENSNQTTPETSSAATLAHHFTFGYKYYSSQGIGARLNLGYSFAADQYAEDSGTSRSWQVDKSGLSMNFGLSYRF